MRPPRYNPSPRPSSTSSSQSIQSNTSVRLAARGPRRGDDICVGEELKIAVTTAVERFRLSEEQKELEFPSSLTATERAYVHRFVQTLGLKSKSKGKGATRCLTVTKKDSLQVAQAISFFNLVRNSRHQIVSLGQKFPLTSKERQDLQPRTERGQHNDGISKELIRTATGRLNNGVPQVPPAKNPSDLEEFRKELPVYKMKEEITRAINNNKIVLVSGETGSGKTTQVPQMILDDCKERGRACRIFCTQPRRLSALSVAERVAAERGEKIGQTIGYQIRLESRTSPKTLLTFCTNGVLLRTLMGGDTALGTVTHVIVDEIHERDRFSDFLLVALRDILPKYRNLKLILMSAALNIQLFSTYFTGCPIISVPGKLFDVKEYYLEDVLKLTGYSNKEMEKYKRVMRNVPVQQQKLDDWCAKGVIAASSSSHKENPIPDDLEAEILDEGVVDEGDEVFDVQDALDDISPEEVGQEKEELEAWVMKEMDELLSKAWLEGDGDSFHQIFHLISSENVSVDYRHSETSVSPLMVASGRGFFQYVEQLLNLGANIKIKASNDWTALDWARNFEQSDISDLLEAYLAVSEEGAVTESNDLDLEKMSDSLTEEDRELLNIYHHSWDDEKVNLQLITELLQFIHSSDKEGAILVFLPGYDEIVTLRDKIMDDQRFADSNRYIIYTLHSMMQSVDQKRVFKKPAAGVRKFILSTNIAETSITINDVVFVIDAGKVKEKSYDALTSVSMLKALWVSKASSLQRKGRAGRCQPGICYHLYSRVRYDSLQEYQDPEILRYPLQELCLHTKLLAPTNTSIADFLAKAPEPPAYLITRNAVHLLKQIDALDAFEDMTELGHHLADLPLEPKYGKMILYSVVLKCLDPVLTIASALAYRDPFTLPQQPYMRRNAAMIKRHFAAGTHSDHMALLRSFQSWQKAKMEGWERSFCDKNFVSASTMEMIMGMRTQLLGQLRASGFVRARGGGDIRDLNSNSENWSIVKAALCAGMYPSVIRVDRSTYQMTTMKESKVRFHTSSVLSPEPNQISFNTHRKALQKLPTDWLIFEEITRAHRLAQVKCCTVVSPLTLAIFAGPAKLPLDIVRSIEEAPQNMMEESGPDYPYDENSDSEDEDRQEPGVARATFSLDDWINFRVDAETANMVLLLRQKWHSMFIRRMRAPSKPWSQADEQVIRTVVSVLTNEEQALGLQQPAGIGQRPRPMSSESVVSSGGSRHSSVDYEQGEDENSEIVDKTQTTPKQTRPFKMYQTSPKKREFLKFARGNADDRSETSSLRSGGSANSGPNSARGSKDSTPCASPRLHTDAFGKEGLSQFRYFVMKSSNYKSLDISMQKCQWATHPVNEKKLNKAFQDGKVVYLVFSVQGSGHFQGVAKMTSESGSEKAREFGSGNAFGVDWIKRANLPFKECHHLLNPWNENKRVQISRDGQEIEPATGESLIQLWDKEPHHIPRMMQQKYDKSPGATYRAGGGEPHSSRYPSGVKDSIHRSGDDPTEYDSSSPHQNKTSYQGQGRNWGVDGRGGNSDGHYTRSSPSGGYNPRHHQHHQGAYHSMAAAAHYNPMYMAAPHMMAGQGPHPMMHHPHMGPVTILQRNPQNHGQSGKRNS